MFTTTTIRTTIAAAVATASLGLAAGAQADAPSANMAGHDKQTTMTKAEPAHAAARRSAGQPAANTGEKTARTDNHAYDGAPTNRAQLAVEPRQVRGR